MYMLDTHHHRTPFRCSERRWAQSKAGEVARNHGGASVRRSRFLFTCIAWRGDFIKMGKPEEGFRGKSQGPEIAGCLASLHHPVIGRQWT